RALAAIVRKALEQVRQVGVGGVRLEPHGVAVELAEVALVALELHDIGRVGLAEFGHGCPSCWLLAGDSAWDGVSSRVVTAWSMDWRSTSLAYRRWWVHNTTDRAGTRPAAGLPPGRRGSPTAVRRSAAAHGSARGPRPVSVQPGA